MASAARSAGAFLAVAALVAGAAACPSRPKPDLTFGLSPVEHDPFFPIAKGDKHELGKLADDGAIACTSCHAAGTESFQVFNCLGCHEHRQDLTTSIHAGIPLFKYESASCLACHARGNADVTIDDATHTRDYFPIDDTSAHKAVQCSGCHVDATDRKKVSCTSCHDAAPWATAGQGAHDAGPLAGVHGTMTGYTWDTAACLTCHTKSENPGKYQHAQFPTEAGTKHEGIACKDCHASTTDRAQLLCTGCHTHDQATTDAQHNQHGPITGYLYQSGSCYGCHQQSQVPGVFDHSSFFPIDTGLHAIGTVVSDNVPVETIACTSCHTDPTTNATVDCTRCHAHDIDVLAPIHNGVTGYAWQTTACLGCHPHAEHDGYLAEHSQFPIQATDVHTGIGCTECHASLTDRTQLLCTTCHVLADMQPIHQTLPGFIFDSTACYSCHQQSQKPGLFDHEAHFPLVGTPHAIGAPNNLVCTDCHTNRADRTQLACTTCHIGTHDQAPMATAHTGIPQYSWSPASCFGCHPNGTAAGAVFSHPAFPITATDTHGQNGIVCADCHTTPGDNTKVSCTACHIGTHDQAPMNTTHANVPGFAWDTTQCLFCHPHSEPVGNIDHARFFPITAGSKHAGIACADCHTNAADRTVVACKECHAADTNPTIVAAHAGIPGFANTSTACLQCHPNSEPVGTMDHAAFFPIANGSKHASTAFNAKIAAGQSQCTACHSSRTDRTQNLCSTCHTGVAPAPSTSHGQVNGFANNSPSCKQCHADSQVDTLASHTVFSPRHHGAKCVDCHRTFRTDKPWGINFAAGVCTKCHSSTCTVAHQSSCGG